MAGSTVAWRAQAGYDHSAGISGHRAGRDLGVGESVLNVSAIDYLPAVGCLKRRVHN
jgi:hypothetical protein